MFWLNTSILGNTAFRWLIAFGVAAGVVALVRLVRRWAIARLAKRPPRAGGIIDGVDLLARTHLLFTLALAATLGTLFLEFPPRPTRYLDELLPVALVGQAAAWVHRGIGRWIERRFGEDPASHGSSAGRAAVLGFLMRLALWSLVLLLSLDVLGFNISTLLASLGIGGIAVALAVQNILGDLFASLSIAMDEPFVIGDFIIVGDCLGAVQYIGLKTTRIRSLGGEQIVISNGDLLKSRIRNFKKMQERRSSFELSVSHRTPPESVARIPATLRRIVEAQPSVRFDRANFKEFSDWGLKFEIAYFLANPDMNFFMDTQEAINMGILRAFRDDDIELAFPTRNLLVQDGAGIVSGDKRFKMEP